MPNTQNVESILEKIEKSFSLAVADGIFLKVVGHKIDDDWLYVIVEPSRPGISASDHANFMSKVERQLRADGDENVLLVPALSE